MEGKIPNHFIFLCILFKKKKLYMSLLLLEPQEKQVSDLLIMNEPIHSFTGSTCLYWLLKKKKSGSVSCSGMSTLCDPMDCSPPGSSIRGILQVKNTGVDCHSLLQGVFLTQELNLGLLHCKQTFYHLNHQWLPARSQELYWSWHWHGNLRQLNEIVWDTKG